MGQTAVNRSVRSRSPGNPVIRTRRAVPPAERSRAQPAGGAPKDSLVLAVDKLTGTRVLSAQCRPRPPGGAAGSPQQCPVGATSQAGAAWWQVTWLRRGG